MTDVPLLTPEIPGTSGRIRTTPEDFEVEEVPSYEPSGEGEHLFLWVRKRDVGPEHLARTIAQRLNIPVGEVGTAGLKDRHAVTQQWVSVPASCEANSDAINGGGIFLLKQARHNNKLKPGHLRGNRFKLRIRDTDPTSKENAQLIVERIRTLGLPNFYGPQRFGRDGSTLELGLQCLQGNQSKRIRPFQYKFALSAVQSMLFNEVLARRIRDGFYRTVLQGDVMTKWPIGGMFVAEDVKVEQARFDARETVSAGPMFGKRTYPSAGVVAGREATVLNDNGLSAESFDGFGKLMSGTRRQNIIYIDDLSCEWEGSVLLLNFTLPAGSYATVLLREVMKVNVDAE